MTHYEIYQEKNPTFMVDMRATQYRRDNYKEVYAEYFMDDEGLKDYQILEKLFIMFNVKRPQNYNVRSMSVGDIVALGGGFGSDEAPRYYQCCMFGWKLVELK